MATKKALVILAAGAEEMEFVIAVDVLRRAEISVIVGGLSKIEPTKCSRDVVIVPDKSLADVDEEIFDAIVLPGGLHGAGAMKQSKLLGNILKNHEANGKCIAAICAAPTALLAHSIGYGKSITSYPSVKDDLKERYNYIDDKPFVQDGNFITSRGPGTAMIFALKIVEYLVGIEKARSVASGMLFDNYKL